MRTRFALALVVALAGSGCSEQVRKPNPGNKSAPAPAAQAAAKPADAGPAAPEWSYSSAGKRDPFRSFLKELDTPTPGGVSPCTTPLGRFDVEQLRLVAVVTGLDDPVAMLEAPTGVGFTVRRGACIGKNGGVISAVRSGELVVSEWAVRADGTRDKTQTVIRLPREASLNIEE